VQNRNNHTKHPPLRAFQSLKKIAIVLAMAFLLFQSNAIYAQVINNTGAAINVTTGTVVESDTLVNTAGDLLNDGEINLQDDYFNIGTTRGDGDYNIGGNWTNTGVFNRGTSTVQFRGNKVQTISSTGDTIFYNLIINNSGSAAENRILLLNNVIVSNTLRLELGNVNAGTFKLNLSNQTNTSLEYPSTTRSRVIGKFERGVYNTGPYLFPIGSDSTYNPLNLNINVPPTAGSVLSEFILGDPGSDGLPLRDDSVEVFEQYHYGYWGLKAENGFESTNYDINMGGEGFDTTIFDITRVIKRLAMGPGDWYLDGVHRDGTGTVGYRDSLKLGINNNGNHFAYGKVRPYIWTQPADTAVCEGESASFSVTATGKGKLFFQWQEDRGSGIFTDLNDGGVYSGTKDSVLVIDPTFLSMTGYQYRVIIVHRHGYYTISDTATLIVNPIPQVFVTPKRDTLCNYETTNVVLTSNVPNTVFNLEVFYNGNITGATTDLVGAGLNIINQTLTNTGNYVDSVMYVITPTGPGTTYCVGIPDTVIIYVNPTANLSLDVLPDTIVCDETPVFFDLTSENGDVLGSKKYQLSISNPGGVSGVELPGEYDYIDGTDFTNTLINPTNEVQVVTYTFHPVIKEPRFGRAYCDPGNVNDTTIRIWVNPTPVIILSYLPDTVLCDEDTITFTTLTGNGNLVGDWVYDVSINSSDLSVLLGVNGASDTAANSYTQNIKNTSTTLQWVDYTFIPKIKGVSTNLSYCNNGIEQTIRVWINPIPYLSAIAEDTIYCDTSTVVIDIENLNGLVYGNKIYDIIVEYEAGAVSTTYIPVRTNLENPIQISDDLVNNTDSLQIIKYIFIPIIHNPGNSNPAKYCDANGIIDTVTIYLNPTPRIIVNLNTDTLVCDSSNYILSLNTGNGIISSGATKWYNISTSITKDGGAAANSSDVEGLIPDGAYMLDNTFTYKLVNNTRDYRIITYNIKPVFLDVNGHYPDCDKGIDTTIIIYLNPTPVFDTIIISDTVICNETFITITPLNTQIVAGNGVVKYEFETESVSLTGYRDNSAPPYLMGAFTDLLVNSSDSIQPIEYKFSPLIDDPDHPNCFNGIPDSVLIKVAPTLLDTAKALEYIGGRNIKCFGESNGEIYLHPYGGYYLDDYFYEWDINGSVNDTINSLNAGTYTYTVRDVIGCEYPGSLTLTEPEVMDLTDSIVVVGCSGGQDGKIFATTTGGSNNYLYSWEGFQVEKYFVEEDSIIGLAQGEYFVWVYDENYCTDYIEPYVDAPDAPSITGEPIEFGSYNLKCFGDSTGSISITPSGEVIGEEFYSYEWRDAGNHIISTLKDIAGLTVGDYTIEITDTLNCSAIREYTIEEPPVMSLSRIPYTSPEGFDVSCYGESDGRIDMIITNNDPLRVLSFEWTRDGDIGWLENGANIIDVPAGTYNYEVTDDQLCSVDTSFTLVTPPLIESSLTDSSDYNGFGISCNALNDGSLNASIIGGHGNYNYLWSTIDGNLSNTEIDRDSIWEVPAGTYTLTITDGISCVKSFDYVLTEAPPLSIDPILSDFNNFNISCFNDTVGFITLQPAGGVQPYNYVWTSSAKGVEINSENQLDVGAGEFNITLYDLNNCEENWDITLIEPEVLSSVITPTTITCNDINDGAANLEVSGGVFAEPYDYIWSNGEISEDIEDLYTGEYSVIITDANNCVRYDTTFVTQPQDITIELTSPLQYYGKMISCNGESDARINSVVYGGVGSYDYLWLNSGDTTTSINNVPAGYYYLQITDENDCSKTDTIEIIQPTQITTEVFETNPSCYKYEDGFITLIPQGGTPAYTITWQDIDQFGQKADSLAEGVYNVRIQDLNDCYIDTFGTLTQPDSIYIIKNLTQPYCPDKPDGIIDITPVNVMEPYTVNWSDEGMEGLYIEDMGFGTYILEIVDNNLCVYHDTTVLKSDNISCLFIPTVFTPDGDGINDIWEIGLIDIYPDVIVEIYNRWGELIYVSNKGYTNPWDGTYKDREMPIDSYYFVLIPGKGKEPVTGNVTIIR